MALFGLPGLSIFPGPTVKLEDIQERYSSKTPTSKTFSAKDIKSMEELNKELHAYVDTAFRKIQGEIHRLFKN